MSEYKVKEYNYTPEEKQLYWNIGTGLQAVDNLNPSAYLRELIAKNVKGEIDLDAVDAALQEYHQSTECKDSQEKEADFVSTRITRYLQEFEFTLHPLALKQIHGYLFEGFPEVDPGEYRTENFSKAEAILNGFSVRYEDYKNVSNFLDYDIQKERKKSYCGKTKEEMAEDISSFISGIWQIHPFREGNTKTVAVFAIMYLKSLGFQIENQPFETNCKYFRDALVRANFSDVKNNIARDSVPLRHFFENVMYDENYNLKREEMGKNNELEEDFYKKIIKTYILCERSMPQSIELDIERYISGFSLYLRHSNEAYKYNTPYLIEQNKHYVMFLKSASKKVEVLRKIVTFIKTSDYIKISMNKNYSDIENCMVISINDFLSAKLSGEIDFHQSFSLSGANRNSKSDIITIRLKQQTRAIKLTPPEEMYLKKVIISVETILKHCY